MFQGETAITIDDKGRLAIPTSYRDLVARECGNRLVITYNPFESGCLYLYPQPVWERVRDQVAAGLAGEGRGAQAKGGDVGSPGVYANGHEDGRGCRVRTRSRCLSSTATARTAPAVRC